MGASRRNWRSTIIIIIITTVHLLSVPRSPCCLLFILTLEQTFLPIGTPVEQLPHFVVVTVAVAVVVTVVTVVVVATTTHSIAQKVREGAGALLRVAITA